MSKKWYVIQVLSTHEKKAKRSLVENATSQGLNECIEEVLLPTENVIEVKQGKQKISERRLWPGYLIVKMELNDDSWMCVKNTSGVIDFLGGGAPTPLTDEEVAHILEELATDKEKVTQKHQFNVGDRVKVVDGVFVNFIGTVMEVNYEKGRLSVLVSIFGRDTRVDDLEFWQVEELSDDEEESEVAEN